jgi:hypothetical protein
VVWETGQSGNPNGRPPKEQSLSHILKLVSEELSNFEPGGKKYQKKEILAHRVWDALLEGSWKFRDGREIILDESNDLLKWLVWLLNRTDGTPPQAIDVTSGDEPLQANAGTIIILPSNGREIETPTGATDDIPE